MPYLLPENIKYRKSGLDEREVKCSREKYGTNALSQKRRSTFLHKYLSAFGDPIIKILCIALALNLIISIRSFEFFEPMGIAIALFLATFVSTLSEYGSESAFLKMEKECAAENCRVMRGGKLCELPSEQLVAGDTVHLLAGERVPADGVIASGRVLVDMSALTGESAEKERKPHKADGGWSLESRGLLFRGCVITSGECIMTVGRVGDSTMYGSIAHEVQKSASPSPLTQRLSRLARIIGIIGYIAAGVVFFADLFGSIVLQNGFDRALIMRDITSPSVVTTLLHALTLAITVVVVAVPEGLPMMITVVLSSNMARLKRDHVLVKRLVGIETAGCINMLFCDKTGTLTEGRLSVIGIYGRDGNEIPLTDDMRIALGVNNESVMIKNRPSGGNATDRALLAFVKTVPHTDVLQREPFDSEKKYSAVKVGGYWYIKGAPEIFFTKDKCTPLYNLHKSLTERGIRVIAMAKGESVGSCRLIGLAALSDKVRRGVPDAVAEAKTAGIRVCMITGDSFETAKAVAAECGILEKGGITLDHNRLEQLTDCEVREILPRLQVVARALPSDKSRLTRIAREMGMVSAMTGDGINDAPALKSADVGFAMGSGTEVAKQAGDIVIMDDSFLSIIKAVLYGRTIFRSIRKFIVFQLTVNLCAVGISVIGPFIGVDTPVTVMQMLWINMIMDTLAGLAFAGEAPDREYMNSLPVTRTESVLTPLMCSQIAFMCLHMLTLCTLFLTGRLFPGMFEGAEFMSAFFALFVFSGLFAGVCARCPDAVNIFRRLSKNRAFTVIFLFIAAVQTALIYFGGELFRTAYISPQKLLVTVILSASVTFTDLLRKIMLKNIGKKDS